MMDPRYNQQQNSSSDWMSKLTQIKNARKEFERLDHLWTPAERETIGGNINADARANYGKIYQGVKARLDNAKGNYKAAAAKRAGAIAKEINSWDPARFTSEMQAFQMRVGMELGKQDAQGIFSGKPVSKRVEALYREAQASGDRYKMRAAAEVLMSANIEKLPVEQQIEVQLIAREASDNLDRLRNTEDIKAAIEGENQAIKQIQDELQFVKETGAVLRDNQEMMGRAVGGFAKLAQTVKFEQEGREVKIKLLDVDDPEITGIEWLTDPDTVPNPFEGGNNE